jgi:peptide/nickel transport system permease protein
MVWRLLGKNLTALFSVCVLLSVVGAAFLAPALAPYAPDQFAAGPSLAPPSIDHLFGTDRYGRDVLSRILFGARLSLPVGGLVVMISVILGSLLGMVTGFVGRRVDAIGLRIIDIWLGFPSIMLALLVIAVLGIGIRSVVLAAGVAGIPGFARVTRGITISVRENTFVEAARAAGASNTRILFRHILPNIQGTIIVLATLRLGQAILVTSALGFLGMGVQPPTPEWGTMLSEGREFMRAAPWLMIIPGMMLFVTVLSVNLLGDYLREAFDVHLRLR